MQSQHRRTVAISTPFAAFRAGQAARLLIRVLPTTLAVAGLMLGLASETWADGCCFTGGPSVRVSPNIKVEFRWTANFVGDGRVEIFDNPNGGVPIAVGTSSVSGAGHTIEIGVGGVLQADTTYFFRVIHKDPTNVRPDLTNDPAPYPPFFTGVQAIGDVFADVDVDSAVISWVANVIGFGRVDYGSASPAEHLASDVDNSTNHAITLAGLSPGTAYQFRVSNRHAIDGDSLAETTGMFTTLDSAPSGNRLTQPLARPRVIHREDVATLSVRVRNEGKPVPNVLVHFQAINGTAGGDAISDATGKATIWMQGVTPGLLRVEASSPDAGNRLVIPVVVRL